MNMNINKGAVNIGFENVHKNKAINKYDFDLSILKFFRIILNINENIIAKKITPYFLINSRGAISIL